MGVQYINAVHPLANYTRVKYRASKINAANKLTDWLENGLAGLFEFDVKIPASTDWTHRRGGSVALAADDRDSWAILAFRISSWNTEHTNQRDKYLPLHGGGETLLFGT